MYDIIEWQKFYYIAFSSMSGNFFFEISFSKDFLHAPKAMKI